MQHLDCGNPPDSKYARVLAAMAKNDCIKEFLNTRKVFLLPSSDLFPWKNGQLVKNSEKLKCGDHKSFEERKSLCSKSYNCSFNQDKDRNTGFGLYITIKYGTEATT